MGTASAATRPGYVERFTLTERLLHWVHASAFFVLLGSGLVLYLPSLSSAVARRPLIKDIHFWTGISWAGAILLVFLLGNRRALAATIREIDVFDRDDRRFLAGDTSAPQGRFNAGQKINAVLTAAFAVLFFVSGLLLWYGERDTRFRLGGTVFLHDTLMYLSVVIVAGHLYLSLLHPTTRHALRGMTLGTVRADWARRHHAKWRAVAMRTSASTTSAEIASSRVGPTSDDVRPAPPPGEVAPTAAGRVLHGPGLGSRDGRRP